MKKTTKVIIATLVIAVIALLLWKKYQIADRVNAIGSTNAQTADINPLSVPHFYNQRDKRWASDKLGNTHESVGKVGCLISSVAMNFAYYGENLTPKELNEKLRDLEGYTKDGWLIWNRLSSISNDKLHISFPKLSHESIEKALKNGQPVLTKVFIHRVIPHWVLVVGKKGGEYLMLDPLTKGELAYVSAYGDYIYAIRVLEK